MFGCRSDLQMSSSASSRSRCLLSRLGPVSSTDSFTAKICKVDVLRALYTVPKEPEPMTLPRVQPSSWPRKPASFDGFRLEPPGDASRARRAVPAVPAPAVASAAVACAAASASGAGAAAVAAAAAAVAAAGADDDVAVLRDERAVLTGVCNGVWSKEDAVSIELKLIARTRLLQETVEASRSQTAACPSAQTGAASGLRRCEEPWERWVLGVGVGVGVSVAPPTSHGDLCPPGRSPPRDGSVASGGSRRLPSP
mmetsp:Transcript_75129/g.211685  ORF Transcript_75129/g.211685 Transcript_75129/m.211685 type:complete len:254 (-) Transcript_75129:117-878(-)